MILLGILAGIAVLLTCTMFVTRQTMLGFPCAIFFAIFGGHCYTQSLVVWDIYYFLFFASMGMVIFCVLAMYGLRDRDLSGPDADKEKFIDEEKEPDLRGGAEAGEGSESAGESEPSGRVKRLRDRASKRRTSYK